MNAIAIERRRFGSGAGSDLLPCVKNSFSISPMHSTKADKISVLSSRKFLGGIHEIEGQFGSEL